RSALTAVERTRTVAAETVHRAQPGVGDELDFSRLARLEAHRGSGGNDQPIASRRRAIESKGRIGFEEMVVGSDLDRAVARVGDGDSDLRPPLADFERALAPRDRADGSLARRSRDRMVKRDELRA